MNLSVDYDFEVYEIIDAMNKSEKKEMMEELCEYFEIENPLHDPDDVPNRMILPDEKEFKDNLEKLKGNYMSLSQKDINYINNIASRF